MENLRNKAYHTLRKSESFFKTDMVYLAKGNFWQLSGQFATSLMSLGLLFVFANFLSKETYGTYRYILSIAGVLNIFTLTGMNQSVAQAVANGNDGSLRTSVIYQVKWNTLQLIAFWFLGTYYLLNDNLYMGASFILISFFAPLTAAFNTYGAFLEGKKNFKLNNLFSILATLIYVLGLLLAILLSGEVVWLVVAYTAATFVSSLIFYLSTIRIYNPPISESGEVLKYGRELTFIGFMGPVVSQLDKIILSHFWGATALAVYSLAMAVPERATSIIKSWAGIGLPKFSTKTPSEINQVFYLRIIQGMGVGLACFVVYYLLAPYLFKYLIPSYIEGLLYSQILAISFIFALPNRYVALLLTSQKLSKIIFVQSLVQNTIKITLYIILGIWGGILGLILAQVLNSFISLIVITIMWRTQK